MAVLKMSTLKVIGRMEKLDDVIAMLCETEMFQPEPAQNFFRSATDMEPLNEANPYTESLRLLSDTVKASGRSLKRVNTDGFFMSGEQINCFIERLKNEVAALQTQKADRENECRELKSRVDQLEHFKKLSVPLDNKIFNSEFIKVRFGRIPLENYRKLQSYDDNPYVLFFPCDIGTYCWGMYLAPTDHIAEVDRIFANICFERLKVPVTDRAPAQAIEKLSAVLNEKEEEIKSLNDRIEEYWKSEYELCLKVYTQLYDKNRNFELRKYAVTHTSSDGDEPEQIFIYAGFIPTKYAGKIKKKIDAVSDCDIEIESSEKTGRIKTPTLLKNNRFVRPYEFYVEMFGTPDYSEIDPTLFVGITYTVLFGVMFADVGQGIALSLIALIMWAVKKMKIAPILFRCGISSAIFGFLFGSVFGYEHLLDPVYKSLFNVDGKLFDVLGKSNITLVLFAPVGIGAVLILLAMLLNIYSGIKQRDCEKWLFSNNGVAGFIFYGAVVFAAAELILFEKNIISKGFVLGFIVAPLVVMLFKEVLAKLITRKPNPFPKKWGDFIIQNFFEVFDYLISYVSNTLSFMRVGAFVIIHAIMMEVVFSIAQMCNPVMSVVVIVLGNIIVMALEALLVSIQELRLEFYEMFSRFFEGSGRPFKPVRLNETGNN